MRRTIAALFLASFALALQAQTATSPQCGPYSIVNGWCEAIQVVPWVPVSNTELTPGDLGNGIMGPGWKSAFSFSNTTQNAVGVSLDLLNSNNNALLSPGILFFADSGGAFGVQQADDIQFPVNPGQTRTMTFLSAANYPTVQGPNGVYLPGTPTSSEVDIVMHVRYDAPDLATLNAILGQGSVSSVLYQADPTSGQLTAFWSSVSSPRPVLQLTNNAYANVSVTPLAFRQANMPVENVAFAVNNTSNSQQTMSFCLTRSDGHKFPCISQVMGPWQSMAFIADTLFGPQTFTNGNVSLFQGKITISSSDKVACYVLQVVGGTASGSPCWNN